MAGRLEFELRFAGSDTGPRRRAAPDDPLRLLVIGDFSGAGHRGAEEAGIGSVIPVDVDNFDRVMARMTPRLTLPLDPADGAAMEVDFQELDDFHPENLVDNLAVFDDLRRLRSRLMDPASFEQAAREMAADTDRADQRETPSAQDGAAPQAVEEGTFERLLGARPASVSGEAAGAGVDPVARLIARIVEPHIARGADPDRQRMLVAAVDDGIAGLLRAILHDARFQALEAAWRGLRTLVFGLETGGDLQVFVLDAGRDAVVRDFAEAAGGIEASALYQLLVDQGSDSPDGSAWSLIVGDFAFGPRADDIDLLAGLGAVAGRAGGAFVGGADPSLMGCADATVLKDPSAWKMGDEDMARWQILRGSSVAGGIALALPRLLLRLPYGAETDPVVGFDFEEMSDAAGHDAFLWGNAAFGCALVIGRSFEQNGWDMAPGDILDIDELPAYVTVEDGQSELKPCAEQLLSRRTADAILAHGVLPVMSHANRNAVQIARIQSIADPPAALAGPWG